MAVAVLAVVAPVPVEGAEKRPSGRWTGPVGDAGARYGHVAVRLAGGQVLIAGGMDDNGKGLLSSAVLYHPGRGVTPTASMSLARYQPAGALLGDGSVLVTGGYGGMASADRYVVALDRWIPAAAMHAPRWAHSATLLPDGRLLVVGGARVEGCCQDVALASAEIYDPLFDRWTPAAAMHSPRHSHTATVLVDGRVLVVGGKGRGLVPLAGAEVYDPPTDSWRAVPDMSVPRVAHAAAALRDGRVLVAGGVGGDHYWSGSEIFDPVSGQWSPAGDMSGARAGHTATLLPDGTLLIVGGLVRWNDPLATAERYDPGTGHWDTVASMGMPRYLHTATVLANGHDVAFVGGWNGREGATGDVGVYRP